MPPFDIILTYALYAFALSYLLLFGAFFLHNDWALRFLFRFPLREVLRDGPSADTVRWTSIGMIFHRMEASFGLGIAVLVASMTWAAAGNLRMLSVLSAAVSAHAVFVGLNHTLNYAGHAEFCQQQALPPQVRRTIGLLRYAAVVMAVTYGALAIVGLGRG